jgi:RNA polymerase sigma factor (sigma-70 family)
VGTSSGGRRGTKLVVDDTAGLALTFDDVYREQRPRLVRTAYLIVRSQHVAEELVHDGFIKLHQHFDTVEAPGGFLHTTVVRLCVTWLKRRDMEHERLRREPAPEVAPTGGAPEDADELWAALARMDPERRAVLVLRFYEDLPYEQIAEIVECPIGTVRSRIHRGLADLRKEVER